LCVDIFQKAKPSAIISHSLSLDEAPEAYQHFDKRDKGLLKYRNKEG
jgi:threonine dehydrogenase-like Zn-dependent dehydrogenase